MRCEYGKKTGKKGEEVAHHALKNPLTHLRLSFYYLWLMSITEVRNKFHALIDELDNPVFLEKFLEIMEQSSKNRNSKLWSNLSSSEQVELLKAYEASLEEKNFVANEDVMAKYGKWR